MFYSSPVGKRRPYKDREPPRELSDAAESIKAYRRLAGWTQDELARAADVSTVALIEAGLRKNPRDDTLEKLASAFSRRLGYEVTARDLRSGPPSRLSEEAERALQEFLSTPVGRTASSVERFLMRQAEWPAGRQPSARSWMHLFESLRATEPESIAGQAAASNDEATK